MDHSFPDLNQSDFIRSVRFLERTGGLPAHRADTTRPLRPEEIRRLEHQQNRCADWSLINVAHDFLVQKVLGNHFIGRCVLGTFRDDGRLPAGIYHSTVRDSVIGDDAVVYRCPLVEDTILDRAVTMIGSRTSADCENIEDFAGCRFSNAAANGVSIALGMEPSSRSVPIFADLNRDMLIDILNEASAAEGLEESCRRVAEDYRRYADLPWCYLAPESVVDNARVRGSWIGPGARVEDLAEVVGSTLLSSPAQRVTVRRGAIVEDSVLHRGSVVTNYALVRRGMLFENSSCRDQAMISESIVGPDSLVRNVTVEHSVLGPGTYTADRGAFQGTIDLERRS